MHICIAVPSITDFYFTRHRMSALGARYVADILRAEGFDVSLLDFPGERKKTRTVPLPGELTYLIPHIDESERGPTAFFTSYRRLGPSPDVQAKRIASVEPDAVLISSFAFAYADDALELSRAIRRLDLQVPIVIGGAGPSAGPEYYAADGSIDGIAVGPVEECADALVRILKRENRGGDRQHAATIVRASRDDSKHRPVAFRAVRMRNTLTTMVTRGCTRRCRFCSVHLSGGSGFRTIPIDRVAEGLTRYKDQDVRALNYEDDNLLVDFEYLEKLVDTVGGILGNVETRAENGLDPSLLSPGHINVLSKARMRQMNLSIGSLCADSLDGEHRAPVSDELPVIVDRLRRKCIAVTAYWICGLAGDTKDSVIETLLGLVSLRIASGISPFYAVPGLPDFEDRTRFDGRAVLTKGSSFFPWNGSLTTDQMVTAMRLSRFVTLLSTDRRTEEENALIRRSFDSRRLFTFRAVNKSIALSEVRAVDAGMVKEFFERVRFGSLY